MYSQYQTSIFHQESRLFTVQKCLHNSSSYGEKLDAQAKKRIMEATELLISLKHPVINDILTVSAALCTRRFLRIQWLDQTEKYLLAASDETNVSGHFDPTQSLIRIDGTTDSRKLAEVLIHELTHAVRFFVLMDKSITSVKTHKNFCKEELLSTFKKNIQPKKILKLGRIYHPQYELAHIFPSALNAYPKEQRPEEFLPWFLGLFVRFALETPNESLLNGATQLSSECHFSESQIDIYYSLLYAALTQTIPVLYEFIEGFENALNQFNGDPVNNSILKKIDELETNTLYANLAYKPNQINNHISLTKENTFIDADQKETRLSL